MLHTKMKHSVLWESDDYLPVWYAFQNIDRNSYQLKHWTFSTYHYYRKLCEIELFCQLPIPDHIL